MTLAQKNVAKKRMLIQAAILGLFVLFVVLMVVSPAFATAAAKNTIKNVLNSMIDIVGLIFQAVGVVLSIFAVGQLVLAFKNEDANSKSQASTLLVVGVILIAIPSLIKGLGLVNLIT